MTRGTSQQLDGSWSASAATSGNDVLFVVSNGALYWISTKEPEKWGQLDGGWDTVTMAAVGHRLFLWERSNRVYRVDSRANTYEELTTTYGTPVCSTSHLGKVRVHEDSALYSLDPDTGGYAQYDSTWDATQIVGVDDSLYVFQRDGALYRLGVKNTGYALLDGSWPDTRAAAAHGGRIYALNGNTIYDIDPATGEYESIHGSWTSTHLVSCNGKLYSFEADGSLYAIDV